MLASQKAPVFKQANVYLLTSVSQRQTVYKKGNIQLLVWKLYLEACLKMACLRQANVLLHLTLLQDFRAKLSYTCS